MTWLRSLITLLVLALAAPTALADTCEMVEIEASVTETPFWPWKLVRRLMQGTV